MQAALGGTAVVGGKIFTLPYVDGATEVTFLYAARHSGAELVRMAII
jgi:hypothetical protein